MRLLWNLPFVGSRIQDDCDVPYSADFFKTITGTIKDGNLWLKCKTYEQDVEVDYKLSHIENNQMIIEIPYPGKCPRADDPYEISISAGANPDLLLMGFGKTGEDILHSGLLMREGVPKS
jgi:hypothetical protein